MKRSNKKMSGSNFRTNKVYKKGDLPEIYGQYLLIESLEKGIDTDEIHSFLFENGGIINYFYKNNKPIEKIDIRQIDDNFEICQSFKKVLKTLNFPCGMNDINNLLEKNFKLPVDCVFSKGIFL